MHWYFLLQFFTIWNILLVILYPFVNKYIDVLFTSLVTLLISTYFIYVNINKYYVVFNGRRYDFNGVYVHLIHFFIHILPFCIILILESNYTLNYFRLFATILIMFLYFLIQDVEKLYMVTRQEMILIFILALVLLHL